MRLTGRKATLAAALLWLAAGTAASAERTDLVIGIAQEPPHLDPTAGATAAIHEIVHANVFEGLIRIGPNGEVQPALAEGWEISEDGTVYTFRLRRGVKFHDGTDLDAEDVKFSLDRARTTYSTNAQKSLLARIDNVEIVDPHVIRVTLQQPQGAFLYNMGSGDAVIVAPETASANRQHPIGTGPFRFEDWARGISVTLLRNEEYAGELPALERIEFRFLPDAKAAVQALLSGELDAIPNLPATDALAQIEADTRFEVVIGATEGETILATNNRKPPFDQMKVRKAIAHALDREEIILGIGAGRAIPIGSHFSPANAAHVDLTGTYPHDVEKAKALLAEAGYEDGFAARLILPPPAYARESGEIIAAQLRQIGLRLELVPMEWTQWREEVLSDKDYELTIIAHTERNDIELYAQKDHYIQYNSPDFDAVIKELDVTTDYATRNELYHAAQRILAEDAVNGFLFQLPKIGVWHADLNGLWHESPLQTHDMSHVRWEDQVTDALSEIPE